MGLISKRLFETKLWEHVNRLKPGLAALLRRKVGDAWRLMECVGSDLRS